MVSIGGGYRLDSSDLADALYPLPGLIDYTAEVMDEEGTDLLALTLQLWNTNEDAAMVKARAALLDIPAIKKAVDSGGLTLGAIRSTSGGVLSTGVAKKTIVDLRKGGSKE